MHEKLPKKASMALIYRAVYNCADLRHVHRPREELVNIYRTSPKVLSLQILHSDKEEQKTMPAAITRCLGNSYIASNFTTEPLA